MNVKSFLAIVVGAFVMYGMLQIPAADLKPVSEHCEKSATQFTQIQAIDGLLCIFHTVFREMAANPFSQFVSKNALVVVSVLIFFILVESGREGASGIFRFPTSLVYFSKLLGVGATFSAIVYPIFTSLEASPAGKQPRPLHPVYVRVALLLVFGHVALQAFFTSLPVDSTLFEHINADFQLVPAVFVLLTFVPREADYSLVSLTSGSKVAKMGFALLAGFSFVVYLTTVFNALSHYGYIPTGLPSLDEWVNTQVPAACDKLMADVWKSTFAQAFAVDFLGMFSFLAFFLLDQEGLLGVLSSTMLAVLFSPGFSFAMAFFRRERRIANALKAKSA